MTKIDQDKRLWQAAELEGRARSAVDATMLTDAALLHPPGLIALAALRQARLGLLLVLLL